MKSIIYITCTKLLICILLFIPFLSNSQEIIDFESEAWTIYSGKVTEHLGRKSLIGTAALNNVEFENGIIEVDMAVTGQRSYPGINFRIQSVSNYESFYIRPHRAGLYPDALQYTPSLNGIRGWQLYSGEGYTAHVMLPENEWFHVKIEVKGDRANIYINNSDQPSLAINKLELGLSKGSIGLNSPQDGSAYFSNFSYESTDDIAFEEPPDIHLPVGMITDWEISKPFKLFDIDSEKTPEQQGLSDLQWQKVICSNTGMVDIARYYSRAGRAPDCIFAKTYLYADEDKTKEIKIGYSDAVAVFLNGQILFIGQSAYQQRDPSFLGIIGLNDAIYMPLKAGRNELILMVAESFGGWGFMAQDAKFLMKNEGITGVWESERKFSVSESVLYDPKRECLYVTNFDQFNQGNQQIEQYISKLSINGEIEELKWVSGINNPLGMTIHDDKIFVTERTGYAIIDLESAMIIEHIQVPESVFLNDLAIDKNGNIYISDTRKNVVWKCADGECTIWLDQSQLSGPNVLYIRNNELLVGNSNKETLDAYNLKTKESYVIAKLGPGFIDGIREDNSGNLIVSHWEGRLYLITRDGVITKILDTTAPQYYIADFEYIPETDIIYIPTFYDNRVMAFKLGLK